MILRKNPYFPLLLLTFQLDKPISFLDTAQLDYGSIATWRMLAEENWFGVAGIHEVVVQDELSHQFPDVFFVQAEIDRKVPDLNTLGRA